MAGVRNFLFGSDNFPTTPNAVSTTFAPANPQPESFYAKLSADGATLLFSTLGPNGERPGVLALDSANDLQVLYGDFGIFGLRRYNATGSAIPFDASSASTGIPIGFLDSEAMAVDSAGNTTVVSSVSGITAPLINPTGTCWFSNAIPIAGNGYLVQIDAVERSARRAT
ncbi:MAG TPA: hypothetical protein VGM43_03775 [Bryobacteraceae bacterium]